MRPPAIARRYVAKGKSRWYELGVTPTLEKLVAGVPALKKAVASPMPASWNQIASWLRQIESLRQAA